MLEKQMGPDSFRKVVYPPTEKKNLTALSFSCLISCKLACACTDSKWNILEVA